MIGVRKRTVPPPSWTIVRKRFHKERQELRNFGVEPLVSELLPVADNLEERSRMLVR